MSDKLDIILNKLDQMDKKLSDPDFSRIVWNHTKTSLVQLLRELKTMGFIQISDQQIADLFSFPNQDNLTPKKIQDIRYRLNNDYDYKENPHIENTLRNLNNR
jgi:hypothetical protein